MNTELTILLVGGVAVIGILVCAMKYCDTDRTTGHLMIKETMSEFLNNWEAKCEQCKKKGIDTIERCTACARGKVPPKPNKNQTKRRD